MLFMLLFGSHRRANVSSRLSASCLASLGFFPASDSMIGIALSGSSFL
jgi:hypothetical protein